MATASDSTEEWCGSHRKCPSALVAEPGPVGTVQFGWYGEGHRGHRRPPARPGAWWGTRSPPTRDDQRGQQALAHVRVEAGDVRCREPTGQPGHGPPLREGGAAARASLK